MSEKLLTATEVAKILRVSTGWIYGHVNKAPRIPILLSFTNGRAAKKIKFGGELFPAGVIADPATGSIFIDFFQIHKDTGAAKGIIAIDLERLQP